MTALLSIVGGPGRLVVLRHLASARRASEGFDASQGSDSPPGATRGGPEKDRVSAGTPGREPHPLVPSVGWRRPVTAAAIPIANAPATAPQG